MRFAASSRVWLASCFLSLAATQTWSFAPNLSPAAGVARNTLLSPLNAESVEAQDCECASPDDSDAAFATKPSLVNQKGSAELFRSAILTDVDGNMVRLGDKMGEGRSVVIFLRHLG